MVREEMPFLEETPRFTFWGELSSPLQECRFRLQRRETGTRRMRLLCSLTGVAYFLAFLGDCSDFSWGGILVYMFCSRGLVFLAGLGLGLTVSPKNLFSWFPWALSGYMLLLGFAEGFEFYVKHFPVTEGYYFFALIIVLTYYLFFPPRAVFAFAGGLGASMLFLGMMIFAGHTSFGRFFAIFLTFLLVNIAGFSILVSFGRIQRQEFLLLQKQQEINRELSREIARRKKMEISLREMALRDHLTGLCNRRYFFSRFQEFWNLPVLSLGFLMLDLDYFKRINDRFGHPAGDAALVECARRFQEALPPEAVLGRLGGEEFGVLLPKISLAELERTGEALRRTLEEEPVETPWGNLELTVSVGAALGGPEKEDSPEELFSKADNALLQAKKTGRNRVCLARA